MKVIVGMASRLRVLPTCLVLPFADLRGAHLHLGILFGNGKVFGKLNLCFQKKSMHWQNFKWVGEENEGQKR